MKITLKNISLVLGGREILKPQDTSIDGSAIGIIGPSGGGKTSLLRMLSGLVPPTRGTIEITLDGKATTVLDANMQEASWRAYRMQTAVVFQEKNLFVHLSALENITLPLIKVHKLPPQEAKKRAEAALDQFGLAQHMHQRPHSLSGGQAQRVAIARAIALRAKIIFFDEPTSALDPENTLEVLRATAGLKTFGQRLVVVTHHLSFAKKASDCILFMSEGRIESWGAPEAIFDSPQSQVVQNFLAQDF